MKSLLFLLTLLISSLLYGGERVVSIAPSLTELVFLLNAQECLVGRSSACDYPAEAGKIAVAGDYAMPNVERTAALKPDLLIATDLYPEGTRAQIAGLGIEILWLPCSTIADYRGWVTRLGQRLHRAEQAKRELARVDGILSRIKDRTAGIQRTRKTVRVAWVIWTEPLMIAGQGSLPDTVLNLIGCKNSGSSVRREYFKPSVEWLVREDPDWIIMPAQSSGTLPGEFWKQLSAVKSGHVIRDLPEDEVLRPGPRLFEGMRKLQDRIYPVKK